MTETILFDWAKTSGIWAVIGVVVLFGLWRVLKFLGIKLFDDDRGWVVLLIKAQIAFIASADARLTAVEEKLDDMPDDIVSKLAKLLKDANGRS